MNAMKVSVIHFLLLTTVSIVLAVPMLLYGPMAQGHDTWEHINYFAFHWPILEWGVLRTLVDRNESRIGQCVLFRFSAAAFLRLRISGAGRETTPLERDEPYRLPRPMGVRFVRFCLASREVQAKCRFGLRRLMNTWEIKPITDLEDSSSGIFAKCQQHGQRFLGARKEHNRRIQYRQGDEALCSNRAGEDHVKARRFAEIIATDSKSGYVDSDSFKPKSFLLVIRMWRPRNSLSLLPNEAYGYCRIYTNWWLPWRIWM
jgi:hypothetical protein